MVDGNGRRPSRALRWWWGLEPSQRALAYLGLRDRLARELRLRRCLHREVASLRRELRDRDRADTERLRRLPDQEELQQLREDLQDAQRQIRILEQAAESRLEVDRRPIPLGLTESEDRAHRFGRFR